VQGWRCWGSLSTVLWNNQSNDADLTSREVFGRSLRENGVTLVRDFLKVPGLDNMLTDSHFAKRDRHGQERGIPGENCGGWLVEGAARNRP